ncbi:MAG: T9SS type A sorting domain-containing protein [Bacteroidetes bacterium]|nr:T9SS type A sorting domain-containing protein [Bacteroidota bacterium]
MKKTKQMIKTLCLTLALGFGVSVEAQTGAALNFDGVNDKVVIGTSATSSLVGNNKVTVEAWVRPTSTVGLGMVVGNYNSPGNSMQFMIRRQNDSWVFWAGPGNNTTYSNTPLTAGSATINVWQHVAGVFNGTVMTLYINGVASATAVTSNTFATATNSLMIGGESASEFFAGDIDEVRIWNVARSQADIQNTRNCEINGSAPNLLANYHFNQGIAAGVNTSVTSAIDDSGNSNTGTLTTMALTGATSNWVSPGGVTSGVSCNGAALNLSNAGPADNVVLPQAISTNSLVGKTKVTVEAWVRPTSLTGLGVIVGNYNTPTNQLQFLLRRDNNAYSFGVGTGVTALYNAVTTAVATATINVWQHVAGVFDGTVISVYINGAFSASVNAISNYTFATTTNSIIIGANGINENYNGDIDEIRIWNTNRSKCEINTFMNCEIPANATNLVANYHFNQGISAGSNAAVTTLNDATSNAFNGTLNTFALAGATSNWVSPGGVVSGFTTALAPVSLTVNANPSLAVCSTNSLSLTGTGANTYTWTGGITNGTAFTPTASNTYTLSGTNTITTCSNSAISNVTVNTTPTVSAVSNSTLICAGQTATLTANGAASYLWNTSATTTAIAVSPTLSTTYTVTGTTNGCVGTTTISQAVSPCTGLQANNNSVSAISVYPNPSTGLFTLDLVGTTDITIVDVLGKVIYIQNLADGKHTINLSNFNNGLYILKAESNGVVKTVRIVKN